MEIGLYMIVFKAKPCFNTDPKQLFKITLIEGAVVLPTKSDTPTKFSGWLKIVNKTNFGHSAPPFLLYTIFI
jgi:hypothetical protein